MTEVYVKLTGRAVLCKYSDILSNSLELGGCGEDVAYP